MNVTVQSLLTLKQVHGNTVYVVDENSVSGWEGDALVTTKTGIALGVLTADCVPVLFADDEAGVVGAAHAGWKGAINGIIEATINSMQEHGGQRDRIRVAIGPSIQQESYEVGDDLMHQVAQAVDYDTAPFIDRVGEKSYFDLPGFVAAQCFESGIRLLDRLPMDTYSMAQDFFSFRRSTHAGEADYGRQISVISLEPVSKLPSAPKTRQK